MIEAGGAQRKEGLPRETFSARIHQQRRVFFIFVFLFFFSSHTPPDFVDANEGRLGSYLLLLMDYRPAVEAHI